MHAGLFTDLNSILRQKISHQFQLKPEQAEILYSLRRGESVLAQLPTGFGKSLCFWLPALAWNWRVVVVSPLLSLIEDQTAHCQKLGLRCLNLSGAAMDFNDAASAYKEAWDVCFVSPERLVSLSTAGRLGAFFNGERAVDLLVMDEMHCLEDWSSFRCAYRELFSPVRAFSERGVPLLGLSASFESAQALIWMRELAGNFRRISAGLGRENLYLQILPMAQDAQRWVSLLGCLRDIEPGRAALVYCSTQNEVDEVCQWLRSVGFVASAYHAGLPPAQRDQCSRDFRAGRIPVMCATSAFGMGIDSQRVERVIHFSLPYGLSAYWQEVSRAGRDGFNAYAVAFWRRSEITRAFQLDCVQRKRYQEVWAAWADGICRKIAIARHLGLDGEACGCCDRCGSLAQLPRWLDTLLSAKNAAPWWLEREAKLSHWLSDVFERADQKKP